MAEGARLESAYTPKGYRGFESRFLRYVPDKFLRISPAHVFLIATVHRPVQVFRY